MNVIKYIKSLVLRKNHIEYARKLGVRVGDNCKFVDNPRWGSEPYLITIGNHCLLSSEITFVNHDGATWVFRDSEGKYSNLYKFGRIIIHDNCFIGTRAIILSGVTIGSNSVVAARSVVTKSIPSGEVWGGVPAKFICKTEAYAEKCFRNKLPYDDVMINTDKKQEMLRVLEMKE